MNDTANQRPAPQPRGDDTRRRLIDAGLRVFGESGYNGASTRALAKAANANVAAIPYHFGGKQGLYHAVIEDLAETIAVIQLPVAQKVQAELANPDLTAADARVLLHQLLHHFSNLLIGTDEAELWAPLIQREQAHPTAAFDILYERVIGPTSTAINQLVGRLTNCAADNQDTIIRSSTILGQIMIFRTSRAAILRNLGWQRYTPERLEQVSRIIDEQVDAQIDALIGAAAEGTS